jgi:flavin-dependent dehydrogenase
VEIKTGSGTFKASYLIGADGANSIVRRFVTKKQFYKKQFGIEADIKMDDPGKYPMEFDFSISKNCYYWIFPKDDHVNIGIYSIDNNVNLRRQQLIEYARARSISGHLEAFKGYPICTGGFNYRPDRWSGSKRILLAGDAAGLSERLLGEGIYYTGFPESP